MKRRKQPYKLSQKSRERLKGVDARLVALVHEVLYYTDVSVIEGLRSIAQQKENVAKGVSQTMKSKHLEGKAVDLWPYPVPRLANGQLDSSAQSWNQMAFVVGYCAGKLGLNITWGGEWKTLVDKPHFQLED